MKDDNNSGRLLLLASVSRSTFDPQTRCYGFGLNFEERGQWRRSESSVMQHYRKPYGAIWRTAREGECP
jgi:hypothetical protein